jgi:hypothetical protein
MKLKFQKILEKKVLRPHETAQYTRIEDVYMEMRPRQQRIGIWGEKIAKDILSRQFDVGYDDQENSMDMMNAIIQKQRSIIKGLLLAYLARHNTKLDHQFDLSLDRLLDRRASRWNPPTEWEMGLSHFKFRGLIEFKTDTCASSFDLKN